MSVEIGSETEQKINRINELLEEKNVTVMDDYFWDIFKNGDTNEEIFSVTSSRHFKTEEKSNSVLDEIINNLEKYKKP